MKKLIAAFAVAGVLVLPASAAAENQAGSCGAVHGAFANENGNFGWLGEDGGTPGYHEAVGQEEKATGYNNSHTGCEA